MTYRLSQRGFTLVELLIAIFLAMMAVAAGYAIYFGSSRAATMQTQDARMQDNARMAMDVLTRNFMRTGFLVNFANYPPGFAMNGLTSKLQAANSNSAPDSVQIIVPSTGTLATLQDTAPKGATLVALSSAPSFSAGAVIGIGLTDTALVTNVTGSNVTLDATATSGALNLEYPGETAANKAATTIVRLTTTTFSINQADLMHPVLEQDGTPLAEDIEDLQIAYGVDTNNNKIIEAGEWTSTPLSSQIDQIRLLRVTIVARTAQEDPSLRGVVGVGPQRLVPPDGSTIEDRPARNVTADGYRRYILTRIIKCRNTNTVATL
jgi:type IV pilus assembly protein PilW